MTYKITNLETGAAMQFAFDRERIARFKAVFPKARWGRDTLSWHVPGKLAAKRLQKWAAAEFAAVDPHAEAKAADASVAFDDPPVIVSRLAIRLDSGSYLVRFSKSDEAISLIKSIPTARWEGDSWRVPATHTAALAAIIPDLERLNPDFWADGRAYIASVVARGGKISTAHVTMRIARLRSGGEAMSISSPYDSGIVGWCRAHNGAWDSSDKCWNVPIVHAQALHAVIGKWELRISAAVEAERAEKAAAKAAPAPARVERSNFVTLVFGRPVLGQPIRRRDRVVVPEEYGREWRLDESDPSVLGHEFLGHEGERACRVYTRDATAEETAAVEARESETKAKAQRDRLRREAVAAVAASSDAPRVGAEPEGEVIWRDDSSRGVGYARRVILTADGWLWHVVYDGSDGAAWGEYNLGYNTRGVRLAATPDLIEAIK